MAKRSIKKARRLKKFVWCYEFPHIPRFKIEKEDVDKIPREYTGEGYLSKPGVSGTPLTH